MRSPNKRSMFGEKRVEGLGNGGKVANKLTIVTNQAKEGTKLLGVCGSGDILDGLDFGGVSVNGTLRDDMTKDVKFGHKELALGVREFEAIFMKTIEDYGKMVEVFFKGAGVD